MTTAHSRPGAGTDHSFQQAVVSFREGRLESAAAHCAEILQRQPRHFDALHLHGLVAMQAGQIERAIDLLQRSLSINPNQPVVHMNLANAWLTHGKPHAALLSSERSLALRPDYLEALNSRANALLELNRPAEALALYDRALQRGPSLALLHNNRGKALRNLQRSEEALVSYQQALQLEPGLRESLLGAAEVLCGLKRPEEALDHCNRRLRDAPEDVEALQVCAAALSAVGRKGDALATLERALALSPDSPALLIDRANVLCALERPEEALKVYAALSVTPEVSLNKGHALLLLRRYDDALRAYREALAQDPCFAKAHCYCGTTLRLLGHLQQALDCFAVALSHQPRYAGALIGRGNVLRDLRRLPEAIAAYEEALRIDPESLEGLNEHATALMLGQRWQEASSSLERLLDLSSKRGADYGYALGFLLQSRFNCCDWHDLSQLCERVRLGIANGTRVTVPSLYSASSLDPAAHHRCATAYVTDNTRSIHVREWTRPPPYRHERIRIAYVSPDFREHPVSMLMSGIFERHDRKRFEVIGVSLVAHDDSAQVRRLHRAFDRFIDVSERRDEDVATLLRELEVDICIDLAGYTANMRAAIFAHRAAPIQVNYLGFPGTLGAPYMDYIIADRVLIPPEEHEYYTEKVVYLPHSYLPPGDVRVPVDRGQTRREQGLPEAGFVFCAFNAHWKITPAVFDLWMALLNRVEGSVLWLSSGTQTVVRNLTERAAARGITAERLVFAPRTTSLDEHLSRHLLADLFLDTLPYNAHTTARDALWAGLPMLTCRGTTFAGRVAAGLLTALGLQELVTTSLEDYQARALELATDSTLLGRLRTQLVEQRDAVHPLFNADDFCRHLEAAYLEMMRRCTDGEPPAAICVGR
jgi:protein O-GlcNAc transferase